MKDQDQRGGDNSNLIQGGTVSLTQNVTHTTVGLTYSETKDLFMTLFRDNFYEMRGQAMEVVAERAEEITVKFLNRMQGRAPEGFDSANDPALQRALVSAQTEYACSGDQELGDVLVDILVDRAETPTGSLQSIILSEALTVAPKLTSGQIAALTVILCMRQTDFYHWAKPSSVYEVLKKALLNASGNLRAEKISYTHMSYAGVGSMGSGEWPLFQRFPLMYPGAFTRGFTHDDIDEDLKPFLDAIFIPAWRDPERMQTVFGTERILTESIPPTNELYPHLDKIRALMNSNPLTPDEVELDLREKIPSLSHVFDAWKTTQLRFFELTSVGMAIGQANWRRHWDSVPKLDIYFE
ncbi:hypothetical protein O4328_16815 [Rhodococcus opacus]|uniref:Trichodiene synthase n=1 Tax=Rhodococcus opacus TaxID=37919 RepID=A0AAX3YM95_RHOOP|nr:LPO_1073/Vpar_1526 family protein [Rhodococcus opacus]MCZ4585345.1 hypothetical protein [Rhodococcus opacus]WLF49014.1 hypothetical protein Q5707_08520 [Rhodococcus opacus]